MIQFNLLPDVKVEYLKARRNKRLIFLIAGVCAGVSLLIFILLFLGVNGLQKQHLSNLDKDVDKLSAELAAIPDLDKILTIQGQLNSLPELHNQKVVASRLFDYIEQLTPKEVRISGLTVDFVNSSMSIKGGADALSFVNKFADTIKFTTFTTEDGAADKTNAFTNVVLTNFNRDSKEASYEITMAFDPLIFSRSSKVTLTTPQITSTRSATEKPALFEEEPVDEGAQEE